MALLDLPDLMVGLDHRFLEAGVDEVDLVSAAGEAAQLVLGERGSGGLLDGAQHLPRGLLLEALFHASETHVLEVLEPLEVGDGDASGVDEGVRHDHHPVLVEVLARVG